MPRTVNSLTAHAIVGVVAVALAGFTSACVEDGDPSGAGAESGEGGAGGESDADGGAGGTEAGAGGGLDACMLQRARLQGGLDAATDRENANGAVLGVITPACEPWVGASGESESGVEMRADHALRIGSVTKTFVAATVIDLAIEGSLDLDDSLETWVPGVPSGDEITLRQLLSMSSGLYNYTNDADFIDAWLSDPRDPWTPLELVGIASAHPLQFEPGTDWEYSNTNYILLGLVIEAASGQSIAEAIRLRMLAPNAVTGAWFDGEEEPSGDLAHGYFSNGEVATDAIHPSGAWAAGAMVATAADLTKWCMALYGGDALGEEGTATMMTTIPTGNPGLDYGLGVMVIDEQTAGVDAVGHGGDIPGYHTLMFYVPEIETCIVSIVNRDGADANAAMAEAVMVLIE